MTSPLLFQCRDDERWRYMLPYRPPRRLLDFAARRSPATVGIDEVLLAINRGEGLADPDRVNSEAPSGAPSRVDPSELPPVPKKVASPEVLDDASQARFVEHMPDGLVLWYEDLLAAALTPINLDI
jgi:hypothetical protein